MKKSISIYIFTLCLIYLATRYGIVDDIRYKVMMARHNARLPFIEKIHIPQDAKYYASESNLNNHGMALETDDSYYIVDDHLLAYEMDKNFKRIPPFEITSPSTGIDELQILGDWMFYTDKHISRVRLDGSGETDLFSGWVSDMYVTPEWIYFVNFKDGAKLSRMTINGQELERMNDVYIWDLMFDGNGFIACIRSEGKKEDTDDYIYDLVTIDISGNITSTLMANTYASNIIKKGDLLYFRSDDSFIYTYDMKTKTKTLLIDRPMSYFALDDRYLFYTGRDLSSQFKDAKGLYQYDLMTQKTKTFDDETLMPTGAIQLLGDYVMIESDYKKDPFDMIRFDKDGGTRTEMESLLDD